jgi:hypothetical protein
MLYLAPKQCPAPRETSIRFGSAKPVKTTIINPEQRENGELTDESESHCKV